MASLTEGVRRCQFATTSWSAASVQTYRNHSHPCSTQLSCGETTCEIWDAGAIPATSITYVNRHFLKAVDKKRRNRSAERAFSLSRITPVLPLLPPAESS
jgi:hypothetical protein